MTERRRTPVFLRAAGAVCAVSTLLLTGCGSADQGDVKMSLMMDVAFLPKHALFFAAEKRGFFEEEGIDVEIMPGSGSTNTVTSVETGRVDAGWADFGSTILSQGRGADVKQVNLLQARSAYAVVGLDGSDISSWDDLRGKTVATEGAGAMTAMWPLALERMGLAADDVEVVHASSESKIPGLLSKRWDANLALYVSDQPAIEALGREASVLKWSDLGIDLYGNGIVMSDDMLERDPETARHFNNALQRGFLWACDHPEEAAQDFQEEVSGFETETITLAIDEQCSLNWGADAEDDRFGLMSDEGVGQMIDVASDYLGLENAGAIHPEDVYSNDYVDPVARTERRDGSPTGTE